MDASLTFWLCQIEGMGLMGGLLDELCPLHISIYLYSNWEFITDVTGLSKQT